jgi:hypothetical protein
MRSSITPAVYLSLYDKVIVHALTPSCPVNLSDMVRACVSGWKRDGEWPPRVSANPAAIATRRRKRSVADSQPGQSRRLSLAFLNRGEKTEKEDKGDEGSAGKAIRRSIQKVLGIGHGIILAPPSGEVMADANGKGDPSQQGP